MKQFIQLFTLAIFCTLISTIHVNAQSATITKGTKVVQIGTGIGGTVVAGSSTQSPYLRAIFEMGVNDDFLSGTLSVGGGFAFKSGTYTYYTASTWRYTYMSLTGRASWHPDFINADKLDAYTGLSLGVDFVNFNYDTAWDYDLDGTDISGAGLSLGWHLGARYQFTENWGAWAEVGFGHGLLNLGAAYTF
ncbi:MAG: hypothetical protein AAF806_25735 [Bacteroidota bacterium]